MDNWQLMNPSPFNSIKLEGHGTLKKVSKQQTIQKFVTYPILIWPNGKLKEMVLGIMVKPKLGLNKKTY